MSYMLFEIFLLMLAAYLAGAMLACFLRRTFFTPSYPEGTSPDWRAAPVAGGTAAAAASTITPRTEGDGAARIELAPRPEPMPEPPRPDLARFERVLHSGTAIESVPRVPLVEIRPQVLKPVTAAAPAVAPKAAPKPEPKPEPKPVETQPSPQPAQQAEPKPAAPAAQQPEPQPASASVSAPVSAAAAAAAAALAAQAQRAAAEAAARAAAEAAAKPAPAPAPPPPAAAEPRPAAKPVAQGPADDLTRIRAIDPVIQRRLNEAGVTRFDQIARWTSDEVSRVNQGLGFTNRVEQENWIEQAQILAKGGETYYSRRKALAAAAPAAADAAMGAAAAAAAASFSASREVQQPARDRLQRINGINADDEALLNLNGITRYSQIATWTLSDVDKVEKLMGRPGRISEERWMEQARILARGGDLELKPARLSEAIREHQAAKPQPAPAPAAVETAAPAPTPEPVRPEVQPLRSVRSAALGGSQVAGAMEDLKRIRGIGVLIEKKLNSLGVTSYEQIANWTGADIDRISQILDFKGRIERENWVEQARILASGGQTEFSRRVDRGEEATSRDPNRF